MNEFEIVKVADLHIGDEIIIPSTGELKYLKILRNPQVSKKVHKSWWPKGYIDYRSIKCSTNLQTRIEKVQYGTKTIDRTIKEYICTPEGHNTEQYVNLNWKTILRVKKI